MSLPARPVGSGKGEICLTSWRSGLPKRDSDATGAAGARKPHPEGGKFDRSV
jgi:hypothetical protein